MSYTITRIYVRQQFAWLEANIADVTSISLQEALTKWKDVRFYMQWGQGQVADVSLLENQKFITDLQMLVGDWIASFTADTLVSTTAGRGLASSHCVTMYDLAAYAVETHRGNHLYGAGQDIPLGKDVDLRLTSDAPEWAEDSIQKLAKNALFAVNGRVCRTHYDGSSLFIINGTERLLLEEDNAVSVIDFNDVGGIQVEAIRSENVTVLTRTMSDLRRYVTRVKVKLDNPMTGYTPFLVMDGFIHLLDGTYKELSANELVVDVDHFTALHRAVTVPRRTVSFAEEANVRLYGIDALTFDVQKYFQEIECFVVYIKNSELGIQIEPVKSFGLDGAYSHYRAPKGLMFFENGKLAQYYMSDFNEFEAALNTTRNKREELNADTIPWDKVRGFNAVARPDRDQEEKAYMEAWVVDIYQF